MRAGDCELGTCDAKVCVIGRRSLAAGGRLLTGSGVSAAALR
jgi:hypothetical protein